jgi:hypothetical protein
MLGDTMFNPKIKQIEELKHQLHTLGYYSFQVDNLIRDAVHTSNLERLSTEELSRLQTELENYIEFARKCYNNQDNR